MQQRARERSAPRDPEARRSPVRPFPAESRSCRTSLEHRGSTRMAGILLQCSRRSIGLISRMTTRHGPGDVGWIPRTTRMRLGTQLRQYEVFGVCAQSLSAPANSSAHCGCTSSDLVRAPPHRSSRRRSRRLRARRGASRGLEASVYRPSRHPRRQTRDSSRGG